VEVAEGKLSEPLSLKLKENECIVEILKQISPLDSTSGYTFEFLIETILDEK
jgi:hypothetical protein